MNLQEVLNGLLEREGGYSNNPADKGGETMWGITEAVARAYGYKGAMKELSRSLAVSIYTDLYWSRPGFADVFKLSSVLAEELLDTGVNMGVGTASRFLQRALNVLNQGDKLYPNTTVDGAIGPMTIAALRTFLQARGRPGEAVLMRMLDAQQAVRYMEIAERDLAQETFVYGWVLNRVGGQ